MASYEHDFIVKMIQVKMKKMGFEVVFMENKHKGTKKYQIPPTIISHRPDIIGYRKDDDRIMIGEAKYYGDIESDRSKRQIKDFISLSSKKNIDVIFGIPVSEHEKMIKLVKEIDETFDLEKGILLVPDRLLRRGENEGI